MKGLKVYPTDIIPQSVLLKELDISYPTLSDWEKDGLKRNKIKGKVFYLGNNLIDFMNDHEVKGVDL